MNNIWCCEITLIYLFINTRYEELWIVYSTVKLEFRLYLAEEEKKKHPEEALHAATVSANSFCSCYTCLMSAAKKSMDCRNNDRYLWFFFSVLPPPPPTPLLANTSPQSESSKKIEESAKKESSPAASTTSTSTTSTTVKEAKDIKGDAKDSKDISVSEPPPKAKQEAEELVNGDITRVVR